MVKVSATKKRKAIAAFISYARQDGSNLARNLHKHLTGLGFEVFLDTFTILGGNVWTKRIGEALEKADFVLALMTRESDASEMCRAEVGYALARRKCVIPVLAQKGSPVPWFLSARNYLDFSTDFPLEKLIAAIKGREGVPLEADRSRFMMTPPLPPNFVDRPKEIGMLRDALFSGGGKCAVAVTAVTGMGGIGKTVLAQALCRDEIVRVAFPDGIVWITLGQNPGGPRAHLIAATEALGDSTVYQSESAYQASYRALTAEKAALIVVDDVWRAEDLEPFRTDFESSHSRLLFTTRDHELANRFASTVYNASFLDYASARRLLAKSAGIASAARLPSLARDIIEQCGQLALAVDMIGARLKAAPEAEWEAVLGKLRRHDVRGLELFQSGEQKFFTRAVSVSFEALDVEIQSKYLRLALLLENMAAPTTILQTLWGVNSSQANQIAWHLARKSMARIEGTNYENQSLTLHSLQHDFVSALFPDRMALSLIHGAIRLSSEPIFRDVEQFASQITARLLAHVGVEAIDRIIDTLAKSAPTPWIRALHPSLTPAGGSAVRILEAHTLGWLHVAVSADGRRAASASESLLLVWNLETGRAIYAIKVGGIDQLAETADGRFLVAASGGRTLNVWDMETGREIRTIQVRGIRRVAVTGDGRQIVSTAGRMLQVWNLKTGREVMGLKAHRRKISGLAVTSDGRLAISGDMGGILKVWDLKTGRELRSFVGHSSKINSIAATTDGLRAVSASDDKTLKVWDLETGREVRALRGHADTVDVVAVTADGRRAVSGSSDRTLKVWDLETGEVTRTLKGHTDWVDDVALTADGKHAVSGSADHSLRVWNLDADAEVRMLSAHTDWVDAVAVTANRRSIISASSDNTLKVWDIDSGHEVLALQGHTSTVHAVAVTPDGLRAVSGSFDNTLKIWDLGSGKVIRTLMGHTAWVNGAAITPDGRRAVSASCDHTLRVWDLETGQEVSTLKGHTGSVNAVAITPDGRRVVSASSDDLLKVWDLETGLEVRTAAVHSSIVAGVAVMPDSKRAISASWDRTVKVWDLETGTAIRTLDGHQHIVISVAVNAEGRLAASASFDHTVRVWDLRSGKRLATFTCDSVARCCAWVDDRRIVAGDSSGHIHFLELILIAPSATD